MERLALSRRAALGIAASGIAAAVLPAARAAGTAMTYDFSNRDLAGWVTASGQWAVEDLPGDPGAALVQRATKNAFNVIVAPAGPFADVEASVRFKPISGREDASGGIVFRFAGGRYYVIRANALEGNFRLYYYESGRREMASASIAAPALGKWHSIRIAANGDRLRGWLNDKPLLDHRDRRFASGQVGLWTKADSVTAFRDLQITPA